MDNFLDNLSLEGAERQIGVWHRNVSLIVHSVIGVTHLSTLLNPIRTGPSEHIFRSLFVAVFNIFISRFFETNCQFQCLKVEKEYKDRRESADKVNLSEAIYIHKGYKTKYACTQRKHMF